MLPLRMRLLFWRAQAIDATLRFLRQPLRAEAALFTLVTLLCLATGVFRTPSLPYPNADRLVRFHRANHYLGVVEAVVSADLAERARKADGFEEVATYRVLYQWPYGLQASANFLPMTGGRLLLGRAAQASGEAVLSHDCWQSRFDARPGIIGKMATLGKGYYRITGVLSKEYLFLTRGICYIAGMPPTARAVGTLARLRPGTSMEQAQATVQQISRELDPDLASENIRVSPLLRDTRLAQIGIALEITALAAIVGALLLWHKGRRGWRLYTAMTLRLLLAIGALVELSYGFGHWVQGSLFSVSLFYQWAFMLLTSAVVFFILRDHLRRCPHCLAALRMPASFGSWGRIVLDDPATEYACPHGHGLLFVHETSGQRDRWMPLDESWRDLFVAQR